MIAPLFKPLGFGDWRAATALITGFTAKEAVVSTLTVLMNTTASALPVVLNSLFTTASAASFLVFTLLYTPCVAAIAACKREMGSAKSAIFMVLAQCGVAWIFAFLVYHVVQLVSLL